ncbi:MAG: acyltransferase [Desulfobacterales bacterium]|nr:MAG: acyltransferase [Desulfobacterales bacterium]
MLNFIIFNTIRLYYRVKRILTDNKLILFLKQLFHYNYLKYHGVETEFGFVRLVGLPIISKHKKSKIIIGKGVTLVSNSYGNVAGVNHPVILATLAEGATIHLNEGCGLSGSAICSVKQVIVGRNSGLGANSCVYDTDFHVVGDTWNNPNTILDAKAKPVEICENVWIAARAVILKGTNIGKGAVIGAGDVVTKDVQTNSIVAGVPATPRKVKL